MGTKLDGWITYISNFGVVVGLLLVAYQVSQTNVALDREAREWSTATNAATNEMYNNYRSHLLSHMDVWRRGGQGDQLDDTERAIYEELAFGYFWTEVQTHSIFRLQNPNANERSFARQILDRIHGNPGHEAQFKRWSELLGSRSLSSYVQLVEEVRVTEYETRER